MGILEQYFFILNDKYSTAPSSPNIKFKKLSSGGNLNATPPKYNDKFSEFLNKCTHIKKLIT